MAIRSASHSDKGIRTHNEDACGSWEYTSGGESLYLFAVADGLGGHAAGEVASSLAVRELSTTISALLGGMSSPDYQTAPYLLREGFFAANEIVISAGLARAGCEGMGTTLVAALCDGEGRGYIGHVGDSRCYLIGDELELVTRDHSYVQDLIEAGVLSPLQAHRHPYRNIVTRIIGRSEEAPDIIPFAMGGKTLLLCSDGLNDGLEDTEIFSLLAGREELGDACRALVEEAKEESRDNITVLLARRA